MASKNYTNVDWVADRTGKVISPHLFGDGELTQISMALDAVRMTIWNPGAIYGATSIPPARFELAIFDPDYLFLLSYHLQNVIEDVYIIRNDDLSIDKTSLALDMELALPVNITSIYTVIITPKTGVKCVVMGSGVEIHRND